MRERNARIDIFQVWRSSSLSNSSDFFDVPDSHSGLLSKKVTTKVATVYGLGHLGSWITYALCSLGIKSFILHDFDRVEIRNMSGSLYDFLDLDSFKTEAMHKHIRKKSMNGELASLTVSTCNDSVGFYRKYFPGGFLYQPFADFYILTTDSSRSRKLIAKNIFEQWNMCGHAETLRDINPVIIDARSNGAALTIMSVPIRDREIQMRYIKELEELERQVGHVNCNEANIIQVPMYVASVAAQMVSSFVSGVYEHYVHHGSTLNVLRTPYKVKLEEFLPTI